MGAVRADGLDLRQVDTAEYRQSVAYVPEALDEITSAFRFNDAVLRHLVTRRDEAVTEPSPMAKGREERDGPERGGRGRRDEERGGRRGAETTAPSPAAETTVTETTVTESPAAESPAAESPAAESPTAESTAAEGAAAD
jgi:hypothetical protein